MKITEINFDRNFKEKTGIGMYIIDRLDKWDIEYIGDLDNKIGMETLDGYNFITSRVTNRDGSIKVETIAFEQFIDEGQSN